MPLQKCTITQDGKTKHGWKYGESGKCFIGPGAKKHAIKQGLAITYKTGEKFEGSTQVTRDEELFDDAARKILETLEG